MFFAGLVSAAYAGLRGQASRGKGLPEIFLSKLPGDRKPKK